MPLMEGLKPDPSKVKAIWEVPPPTDMKGFKRWMLDYLGKFSPRLSDLKDPLRRLEDKEVERCWLEQHQKAFDTVKHYFAEAPMLKYYCISE